MGQALVVVGGNRRNGKIGGGGGHVGIVAGHGVEQHNTLKFLPFGDTQGVCQTRIGGPDRHLPGPGTSINGPG